MSKLRYATLSVMAGHVTRRSKRTAGTEGVTAIVAVVAWFLMLVWFGLLLSLAGSLVFSVLAATGVVWSAVALAWVVVRGRVRERFGRHPRC